MDFVSQLFDTSDFPARWHCGNWTAAHGWLHILSDLGVWSAYFAIPVVIGFFVHRRRDLPFRKVFLLFVTFILLCGMTHLMEAIIFWWPAYRLAGGLKLLTAVVSWVTVFALLGEIPNALRMRTPEELEREIVARQNAEGRLHEANAVLERRVEERTTELKRALVEIGTDRELLKTTLESIGDGLITTDDQGRVVTLNPVAEALTGWTTLEAQGQPLTTVFRIVNEHTREPVLNPVFKALQEGVIVGLANHTLLIHKDGSERPIDDSAAPIRGADLVIKGCVLVFRDVTHRKRMEDALRESEQQLRVRSQILDQVNDVVGAIDNEQKILFLNAAGEQLYGVKAAEMVGRPFTELYERSWPSPEYEAHALATLNETGQAHWEVIHVTRDGRELQVESKVSVFRDTDGQPQGLIAAIRDVTAQRRAAEELRASQHFLERVTEITPGVIHVFDLETQSSVFINRTVATVLGYRPEEIEALGSQVVQTLMHPDDLPRFAAHIDALRLLADNVILDFEHRMRDQSGAWHWFHSRDTVFARNAAGEVSRIIGTAIDITGRKRVEVQLQDSERAFRAIFEQSAVGKSQISASTGKYVRVNQKFCALTGYSPEELMERSPSDITYEPDRRRTEIEYARMFGGEASIIELEKRYLRKDGSIAWVLVNSKLLLDAAGRPDRTITVIQDIHARKQAELELQESQQQFQMLIDAMPQLAWIAQPDGFIHWYNQRWYSYTGTTLEQMEGWGWQSVHDPVVLPEVLERWNSSIETTEPFEMTFPLRGADGVMRPFLTRMIPLKDEQGRVRKWFGTNTDVSVLKQVVDSLRDSEALTRLATEATAVGIWEWNLQTNTMRWDSQVFRIYGIEPTPDGIVHYSDWSGALLPEDLPKSESVLQDTIRRCGSSRREFRIRRRNDGEQRHIEAAETIRTNAAGQAVWVVGTNLDVTARKRLEEDLRVTAAELSEADRRKDEFLATLAHELRNPLAPIRNGLQILRLSGGNSATAEKVRDIMERQLGQMVHLVDDLLDVSRISRGKLDLRKERIELASVLNNAVETSRPLIEGGDHTISVVLPSQPVFLDADPTRLGQVFSNLLNNSAKYSDRGGQIQLAVELQGRDVLVSVKDTGVGIPPEMLPKIFDMFTQVDRSLEKSQGGLGIGLCLVKRLVEMHGGSVEARSEGHGLGSEFVVRLPVVLSVIPNTEPTTDDKSSSPSGRYHILVADDNLDSANSLALMLTLMGNEVRTVHDGLQAVNVAEGFQPEVILLDIGMPMLNGYEACRRIREQSWSEKACLIALTGWGQDEDKRRSREAGFNHHMVKPVDPATLEKLLAGLQRAE